LKIPIRIILKSKRDNYLSKSIFKHIFLPPCLKFHHADIEGFYKTGTTIALSPLSHLTKLNVNDSVVDIAADKAVFF
jgi:hypothetical protein